MPALWAKLRELRARQWRKTGAPADQRKSLFFANSGPQAHVVSLGLNVVKLGHNVFLGPIEVIYIYGIDQVKANTLTTYMV